MREKYHECRYQTKAIHSKVLKQLLDLRNSIRSIFKDKYIILCLPGDNSPPARFHGLPKIYKANIPFRLIVSACGTSTYRLAKFITKILQWYCGNNFPFVKDGKGLPKSPKEQGVAPDKTLTEHINHTGMEDFLEHTCFIPKDKVISLLELVLNSHIPTHWWKRYVGDIISIVK